MKIITNIINALIIASWIAILPIFSTQNINEISLKFLFFESIKLQIGAILSWSAGIGIIVGAILPIFWAKKPQRKIPRAYVREDVDYFDDEEEERDPLFDWD